MVIPAWLSNEGDEIDQRWVFSEDAAANMLDLEADDLLVDGVDAEVQMWTGVGCWRRRGPHLGNGP